MELPDFKYERGLWKKGFHLVAGIDEVGRGCFAGPVVAGAVVFSATKAGPASRQPQIHPRRGNPGFGAPRLESPGYCTPLINDSKKLTSKQREAADKWIRKNALSFGIGEASVAQINKFGIKKATEIAFRRSIHSISQYHNIDFLLIDAFYIPYVRGLRRKNQKAIVKGDSLSISIAAASIIAKVYRDKLMLNLSKNPKYKKYNWHKNKGYGTKEHGEMIRKYGVSKLHRKQFVETWLKNSSSSRAQ